MKALKRITMILGGLVVGLLITELFARLFLPFPTAYINLLRTRAPDLQMDAYTDLKKPGYNPFLQRRPSSQWVCDGKTPEFMNNEGFRDRAFELARSPGKKRLAVIGDSFAEGWMAPRETAFPHVLESLLGGQVEVLNFGLANRSPLRYVALYDQIVRKYRPDYVLVCLYQNDTAEDEALRSYVQFDATGVPSSFDYKRYFRHTPRMPQTVWEKRLDRLQWKLCQYSRLFPYAAVFLTVDSSYRKRAMEAPPPSSTETLWPNTSGYLLTLRDAVVLDGGLFFLTYAPDEGDFRTPNPMLALARQFASQNNIPFFDPSAFLTTPNHAPLYVPGDGHFSPDGHHLFAEKLAEWMKPLIGSAPQPPATPVAAETKPGAK
jgi:lysophospholipase L1-like esterase